MNETIWATSNNGTIEFRTLTSEYLQSALNLMTNDFYPQESVSRCLRISESTEAVDELNKLLVAIYRDGISIVAVEKSTQNVVGVLFNKLQVRSKEGEESFFEQHLKSMNHNASKALLQFMIDGDAACNLFDYCNVNCILEINMLGVRSKYQKRGIATTLIEQTLELGKKLAKGENVRVLFDKAEPELLLIPEIAMALFSSPFSQKIGRKLNFEIAATIRHDNCFHNGKSFASILGSEIPNSTLEFKRLL